MSEPNKRTTYVTPAVRATASRLGVALEQVQGTGAGGRITVVDVERAALFEPDTKAPKRTAQRGAAATNGPRPRLLLEVQSVFSPHIVLELDQYAPNPFLEDLRAVSTDQEMRQRAAWRPQVPTFFESGDLPIFTGAGFDPSMLLHVPWQVRHLAAATADQALVAEIFDRCSNGTERAVAVAGVLAEEHAKDRHAIEAYRKRVYDWAFSGPPPEPRGKALRIGDLQRLQQAKTADGKRSVENLLKGWRH